MGVEFSWSEGEERSEVAGAPRRRRSVRALVVLVILAVAIGGTVWLRAWQGQRVARADLQAVVDAEVGALRRADEGVYLSLQDSGNADWIQAQTAYFEDVVDAGRLEAAAHLVPLKVVDVELDGPLASVEVEYNLQDQAYRRLQFYRRLTGHWRRTAPNPDYWGEVRQVQTERIRFVFREKEERIVRSLLGDLDSFYQRLAQAFHLEATSRQVTLVFEPSLDVEPSSYSDARFSFPSPLLSGAPLEEGAEQELLSNLGHSLALFLAIEKSGVYSEQIHPSSNWVLLNGLAFWEVEQWLGRDAVPTTWQQLRDQAVRAGTVPPLVALWPPYSFATPSDRLVAFAMAESVVAYMVDTSGPDTVPALLEALGCKVPPRETIDYVMTQDIISFEERWRSSLQPGAGLDAGELRPQIYAWNANLAERGMADAAQETVVNFLSECLVDCDSACFALARRTSCSSPYTGQCYYHRLQPGS